MARDGVAVNPADCMPRCMSTCACLYLCLYVLCSGVRLSTCLPVLITTLA